MKIDKNMSFEQANELLEKAISGLEEKQLSLDDSMEKYSQACELLVFCNNKLNNYKGKIKDINEKLNEINSDGEFEDE